MAKCWRKIVFEPKKAFNSSTTDNILYCKKLYKNGSENCLYVKLKLN